MRYIIEASLFHGSLLNRTVIIPSFVYARACEYPNAVCAAYFPMVNRGDAVDSDEWRKLPEEQQMGWRVPMSTMINITHLRRTQPFLLVSEYLLLHNLSADLEAKKYHQNPSVFDSGARGPPSLKDMKRRGDWNVSKGEYGTWNKKEKTDIYLNLQSALPKKGRQNVLGWDQARSILQNHGIVGISSDEGFEMKLRDNGWEVLYTYDGAIGMDFVKNVVNPIRQVAPRDSIRGYVEDYRRFDADVLLLKGEIHFERKPAGLRFTTTDSRDNFSRLVLFEIHPIDSVKRLSAAMDKAMTERNGGRMWMGAHMRRGDFVLYNWTMQAELGDHFQRIKTSLEYGRGVLCSMRNIGTLSPYDVPNVTVDRNQLQREVPDANDKIYLATDERDPGNLAYLSDHGAIMASDLITLEDRRQFGWPLLLTDVLGLVEQDLLARSSYFYAHAMSSFAGGVINVRAANGADPRTAKID
ncbi:hypothetical protein BJ138DRAFT_1168131 [Hygrophoropsis aurantiaca]|uniref:Uncharacterized protein n=1 Tax=Hygrophoropsis aurantiaca TaxID=72124 RepID=A0ACB7ZQT9_9AGAM|nr:hypothetical protein BJ138DRAFT_1168131 [Hygrophoropsis aurantiaca]